MTLHEAWLRQARADLDLATRLRREPLRPDLFCQVAAKCQQAVEKGTKGFVERLNVAGFVTIPIGRAHEVARLADALVRTRVIRVVSTQIETIFNSAVRSQIVELDRIVPTYPAAGKLASRNPEYPFQDASGAWHAPTLPDTFTAGEIKRWYYAAHRVVAGVSRLSSAIDRL